MKRKKDEEKRREEEHQNLVNRMISSNAGGAGLVSCSGSRNRQLGEEVSRCWKTWNNT